MIIIEDKGGMVAHEIRRVGFSADFFSTEMLVFYQKL